MKESLSSRLELEMDESHIAWQIGGRDKQQQAKRMAAKIELATDLSIDMGKIQRNERGGVTVNKVEFSAGLKFT